MTSRAATTLFGLSKKNCGTGDYTEKSDLWSLGVCAIMVLTGQVPFPAHLRVLALCAMLARWAIAAGNAAMLAGRHSVEVTVVQVQHFSVTCARSKPLFTFFGKPLEISFQQQGGCAAS